MTTPARPPLQLPNWLVHNRNFVLLWLAYGIAAFGDHLSEQALLKERNAFGRGDLVRVQALITFGFFLPFVVLGPVAGWWSDRASRKRTMVAADLTRVLLVFNLAFIVALLASWLPADYGDYSIVFPLSVVGVLAAFFSPARQAILPTLIRDDQLVRANAMISALGTIGAILSAVVGGILVQHLGKQWNYHLNALTYLLSAVCVGSLAMSRTRAVPHPPLEGIWAPVRSGFHYVNTHVRVLQLLLLATVYWAAAGVVISVIPAIAQIYFGENYTASGSYRGALGIGLACGATVMTILGATIPIPLALLIGLLAAALWILALAGAIALRIGPILTGACLFGMGGAGAAILVTIMASLQRFVPDSRRGRIFGVSDMWTMAAIVATTGLLGLPHIEHLDSYISWLLAATGLGLAVTAVLAWRVYRRGSPMPALVWLFWQFVRFYAAFWCRARRAGTCTVPQTGPVIVAANHASGVDPLVILGTYTHRLVNFIVERRYYRSPVVGWFIRLGGSIPVARENPGKSSIADALARLSAGDCLGIFPEGGYVAPAAGAPEAKAGVGWLALHSGATVIPCHISGTRFVDNPLSTLFRRHHARVRYGPPVDLSALRGLERDKDAPQRATEQIMGAIRALAPADGTP